MFSEVFERQRSIAVAAIAALLIASPISASAQTPEIERLRQAAAEGRATADDLNDLGTRLQAYYLVDGLNADEVRDHPGLIEARASFQRASDMGDVEARNNLSVSIRLGYGGPQDEAEADRLLYDAATAGSVGANMTLSSWYRTGVPGIVQDEVRALVYMRAAADTGSSWAQWNYAMLVLQGVGTDPDPEEAYRWVVMASDQDDTNAMVSRGVMLATGEGVSEDDAAARIWYQRAAESGHIGFDQGLKSLGYMMFNGEGGPADLERGFAYMRIAAAAGNEQAQALVDHYRPTLSEEQVSRAGEIAEQWIDQFLPDGSQN